MYLDILSSTLLPHIIYIYIYIYIYSKVAREDVRVKKSNCTTGIRTRDPSLVISGALPTELWCSCQPRQNRTTLPLEHQTHFSCETTQAGGTQPSTVTHTFHIESTMRSRTLIYIYIHMAYQQTIECCKQCNIGYEHFAVLCSSVNITSAIWKQSSLITTSVNLMTERMFIIMVRRLIFLARRTL